MQITSPLIRWIDAIFLDLLRQLRWSFLPPLMIYFSAGFSGLTLIVGTFFVKEYLSLSAVELAGLAFWAGLPWALKMPLGHLVDIIWRWKWVLIWLGAALLGLSVGVMYLAITQRAMLETIMPLEAWYILSYMLAPCGLVVQDAVADAMSVEAVPRHDADGHPLPDRMTRAMHTTMQTLGRFSLISGTVAVALLNIWMFSGIEQVSATAKADTYASIYLVALFIPVLSVSGVVIAGLQKSRKKRHMLSLGHSKEKIDAALGIPTQKTKVNPWYFIGGGVFVALSLIVGLGQVPFGQEIIFVSSMIIIGLLMRQLIAALPKAQARMLLGTATIIFFFRAIPRPGDGVTWFNIDVLNFDQQFLSVLSLITSVLALIGMLALRPLMADRSIVYIIALLSVTAGVLSLPNIGLYYGLHNWTTGLTAGIIDARFIAVLDTALESPLGQVAMIPMLAWIARNAPDHLKATFFAVMASFTNLALSASSLGTKYLNQIFTITREIRDPVSGSITTAADYTQLGWLLIIVTVLTVLLPLGVILFVQSSPLKTSE